MERTTLQRALREMLKEEVGEAFDHLENNQDLREGLGLDSVDLVSLVIRIQRRFQIEISTEELRQLVTVGDLLDLLRSKTTPSKLAA